jgi:hypothetical protein
MPLLAVIEVNQETFNIPESVHLKVFEGMSPNIRNARSLKALGLWDKRAKAWSNGNKIKVRVF